MVLIIRVSFVHLPQCVRFGEHDLQYLLSFACVLYFEKYMAIDTVTWRQRKKSEKQEISICIGEKFSFTLYRAFYDG